MTKDGQAFIDRGGAFVAPRDMSQLRLADPFQPVQPNWNAVPDRLWQPTSAEETALTAHLEKVVPPGITCKELCYEFWARGFETFLVGGCVRDAITGEQPRDIDIVTTMPWPMVRSLLESMDVRPNAMSEEHTFMNIGARNPDATSIDIKLFADRNGSAEDTLFGNDLLTNVAARDFTMNAIFYEPIHSVLIDPSGRGLSDAAQRHLYFAHDHSQSSRLKRAQIAVRCWKFAGRGFQLADDSADILCEHYVPCLDAFEPPQLKKYIHRQIITKTAEARQRDVVEAIQQSIVGLVGLKIWNAFFAPAIKDYIS